jgi:hypothetical protein
VYLFVVDVETSLNGPSSHQITSNNEPTHHGGIYGAYISGLACIMNIVESNLGSCGHHEDLVYERSSYMREDF